MWCEEEATGGGGGGGFRVLDEAILRSAREEAIILSIMAMLSLRV